MYLQANGIVTPPTVTREGQGGKTVALKGFWGNWVEEKILEGYIENLLSPI